MSFVLFCYVSHSLISLLNYSPVNLIGRSMLTGEEERLIHWSKAFFISGKIERKVI